MKGAAGTGSESVNMDIPIKGGSKEDTQISDMGGRFQSKGEITKIKGDRRRRNALVTRRAWWVKEHELGFI